MAETNEPILMNTYVIKDLGVETHTLPMYEQSHTRAKRAFINLVNDPGSQLFHHHQDFILIYTGEYDISTALHNNTEHEILMTATQALEAGEKQRTRALQLAEVVRPGVEDN